MRYLVIVGLIIVAGALVSYGYSQSKNNSTSNNDSVMMEDDKMMVDEDKMMEDDKIENDSMMEDDKMMADEDKMMVEGGEYRAYDPSLLSRADHGRVVLFFHAGWCPTCKALENDINRNLDKIPDDLTILKVDYDTAEDLKDKYDIVIQHTLVQVDSSGSMITGWTGGNDLDYILGKLK